MRKNKFHSKHAVNKYTCVSIKLLSGMENSVSVLEQ